MNECSTCFQAVHIIAVKDLMLHRLGRNFVGFQMHRGIWSCILDFDVGDTYELDTQEGLQQLSNENKNKNKNIKSVRLARLIF